MILDVNMMKFRLCTTTCVYKRVYKLVYERVYGRRPAQQALDARSIGVAASVSASASSEGISFTNKPIFVIAARGCVTRKLKFRSKFRREKG